MEFEHRSQVWMVGPTLPDVSAADMAAALSAKILSISDFLPFDL